MPFRYRVEVVSAGRDNAVTLPGYTLSVQDTLELKANPDTFASGNIIEAKLDRGRGPVATLLVTRGTLHVGDTIEMCIRDSWCPKCETVLANEQVTEGRCWRCDSEVEKRDLEQWYIKITAYAQELLDDLEKLQGWPERVKQMQANWIGRSEGAEVDFTPVSYTHLSNGST